MDLREARGNVQGTVQATTARRRLLGDLLIREGLITPAQLKEALQTQTELGNYTPLGQLLVDQKMITQEQLRVVLDKYNKKYRIGDLLVETNAISEEQLDLALQHQKKTGLRLGDVLLQLNFVTERQIKEALCKQLRIPFIDLDSVPIDTALTHLVSKGYTHQVREVVSRSGVRDGMLVANSIYTTLALFVNEFQSALTDDLGDLLQKLVPRRAGYFHDEPRYSDCEQGRSDGRVGGRRWPALTMWVGQRGRPRRHARIGTWCVPAWRCSARARRRWWPTTGGSSAWPNTTASSRGTASSS